MNFIDALRACLPMRRISQTCMADPHRGHSEWMWFVLDEQGDWQEWDAWSGHAADRMSPSDTSWLFDDFLANDWEVFRRCEHDVEWDVVCEVCAARGENLHHKCVLCGRFGCEDHFEEPTDEG